MAVGAVDRHPRPTVLNDADPGGTIIGRGKELARFRQAISSIRREGAAVAVRGAPGIGKSSLLREVAAQALDAGCQLLLVSGVETESAFAYAGLHQLLQPVLGDVAALPAAQRDAIRTALGTDTGSVPELFVVAMAVLNLVTTSTDRRPVVLVVDDLQWLDAPTQDVLAFVARRIRRIAALVVGAYRDGVPVGFSSAVGEEIELAPLADHDARELLSRCSGELAIHEIDRILEHADGNPLALVELPTIWRNAAEGSFARLAMSIPLNARLRRAFAANVELLPALTRTALLVAAIDVEDRLTEILAASSVIAGHEVGVDILGPAEDAGLIRVEETRVRFNHPLHRAGVLLSEPAARRQAAHAALGQVLPSHSLHRTWHLAHQENGPDDSIADELELQHLDSIRRGLPDIAIATLERAAQLTTDPRKRVRRLLIAARHAFGMGLADQAGRLVDIAARDQLSRLERARVEWLRETFDERAVGDVSRIHELCATAQDSAADGDVDLALDLLVTAALRCFWAESGDGARARVVQVAESLGAVQDDPRCIAAIAIAEPIARGTRTVQRLTDTRVAAGTTEADHLRLLGLAARAVGAETHAADLLGRAATSLRAQGQLGALAQVLAVQSAVWIDLGDWSRARASMEEARHLAARTAQPIWATSVTVLAARLDGLTGDADRTLRQAAAVELAASAHTNSVVLADVQLARGFAWLSAGRHADAYAALRPLFDPNDPRHQQREQLSGIMFLAEAAARSDRRDDARAVVRAMEEVATRTTSPILHMHLLYARAVLAGPLDAEALFIDGLAHDLTRWPWVRARLQLAYGSWLRRQRRAADSRQHLRAAATTFELIGATAWGREASTELRAAGELDEAGTSTPAEAALSPQELEIARLAAEGLSNREIGGRLHLSPRTVGSHLYRIFPKLGVRTRTQLAAKLMAGAAPHGRTPFTREVQRRVRRPSRLAAVRATGLLDSQPEAPFDTLAALAADLMDAPFAFVTIVDDARSFWKSCFGEVGGARQNIVGDSFCQYVIGVDGPLLIGDARLDERTSANPSIGAMGVVAWAGHPIRDAAGEVLGTFCVVDTRPREWTPSHGRTLGALAAAVAGEINLRAAAAAAERSAEQLTTLGRFARRLSASATTSDIASALANVGDPLFGATKSSLVLAGEDERPISVYSTAPDDAQAPSAATFTATSTPATTAMQTAREVSVRDRAELARRFPDVVPIAETLGASSLLAAPLVGHDGDVLGAITLAWRAESGFEMIDRMLLDTVVELCRNTIERARSTSHRADPAAREHLVR